MKPYLKILFLLAALFTTSGLMPVGQAAAKNFTTIYTFSAPSCTSSGPVNGDAGQPQDGLILAGETLYGTGGWGPGGGGTIFSVSTNGSSFAALQSFQIFPPGSSDGGAIPIAPLTLQGNTLYGTTAIGLGGGGPGTLFRVNTDGSDYTLLTNFSDFGLNGGLVLSGNNLYGTSPGGYSVYTGGAVVRISTNGTSLAVLHAFTGSDGVIPSCGLTLSGTTLYGAATQGGSGSGTVFALNTSGSGFSVLHRFTALSSNTNIDGAYPQAALVLAGDTLYGTANRGGNFGYGTIFAIKTNGTGFRNLHSFTALNSDTNIDGAYPQAALVLASDTLYGTASRGGGFGSGIIFAVKTNGTIFATLYSFGKVGSVYPCANNFIVSTNSDGAQPLGGLVLSGNTLYASTASGGIYGAGTLFSLSLPVAPPQLTITQAGANVVLTWSTTPAGFTLESTTDLTPPATWIAVSPLPVPVNGQNTVTNPIVGRQQFYRLRQ